MDGGKSTEERELLHEIFPVGTQKEFAIVAPPDRHKKRRRKRFIGRFPLGIPSFEEEEEEKNWSLQRYADDPETGEPGGWMLGDNPHSMTHKGTPGSADDIKNFVALKLTASGKMEVHPIDEAFNFRPTIRHKVYTLEQAEMLMSVKRKPRLASTLRAQLDAADKQNSKQDIDEASAAGSKGTPSNKTDSESEESDVELQKGKKEKKKQKTAPAEHKVRAARALREVVATDTLIDEIKPINVEDWEYSEEADDDDLNMGGDFEDHEKDEMEAEYKQNGGSDSSEDEESTNLDKRGKELKKLIKQGAPEYVPPPANSEGKLQKKKPNNVAERAILIDDRDGTETKPINSAQNNSVAQQPTVKEANSVSRQGATTGTGPNEFIPRELSEIELCRFLQFTGPLPMRNVISPFKRFVQTPEEYRRIKDIVKKIAVSEERQGVKIVTLRKEYR